MIITMKWEKDTLDAFVDLLNNYNSIKNANGDILKFTVTYYANSEALLSARPIEKV